jgi:hypothetical protein
MKTQKNLGIWMDHSTANVIDINSKKHSHEITSKFTFDTKEEALNRSEKLMHNKRQQMHEAYYLNSDSHFKDIKIELASADKMTENQQDAFVKNYFE